MIVVLPSDESQAAAMSSVKSVFTRKAVVRMQLLKDVVGGDTFRVNNKYDSSRTPLPVSEIIERAQLLIGQEVSYDLLGSNCEHFVTLLRYGEGVSEQVFHLVAFLFVIKYRNWCTDSHWNILDYSVPGISIHPLQPFHIHATTWNRNLEGS